MPHSPTQDLDRLRRKSISPEKAAGNARGRIIEVQPWLHVKVGQNDGHSGSSLRFWINGSSPSGYGKIKYDSPPFVCVRPMVDHPKYDNCVLGHVMTNTSHSVVWDDVGTSACYRTGEKLQAHALLFTEKDGEIEVVNDSNSEEWCTQRWNKWYSIQYWHARRTSVNKPAVVVSQPLKFMSDKEICMERFRKNNINSVYPSEETDLSRGEQKTEKTLKSLSGKYTKMCENCGRRSFFPEQVKWRTVKKGWVRKTEIDSGVYYQCEHCRDGDTLPAHMHSGFREVYGFWDDETDEKLEEELINEDVPTLQTESLNAVEQHNVRRM